jgi:hypothetical protein
MAISSLIVEAHPLTYSAAAVMPYANSEAPNQRRFKCLRPRTAWTGGTWGAEDGVSGLGF